MENQINFHKLSSRVVTSKDKGRQFQYNNQEDAIKGQFTGEYKQISVISPLAEAMAGKKEGDRFEFKGEAYKGIGIN